MDYAATFHDDDTNMTALVFATENGFSVALRDDDSGQIVPSISVRIPTLEAAIAKAKEIL